MRTILLSHFVPFLLVTNVCQLWAASIDECRELYLYGKYEECVTTTAEAIEKGVYGESWHIVKAEAEFQLGLYEDSWATIQKALERYGWSIRLRWAGMQSCRYLGQQEEREKLISEIAQLVQSSPWRYTDAENLVTLGEFVLEQGADAKDAQEAFFARARRNNPQHRKPVLALGNLALEKRDFQLAAEIFRPALEKHPEDPDIHFGLARAFASSDGEVATRHLNEAIQLNPNHFQARLMQVDQSLDREQYAEADEILNIVLKLNSLHAEALAFRTVIQLLQNQEDDWPATLDQALSTWDANPLVPHTIGRELSQKYRFKQGASFQRQALKFAPDYYPAKKQLAQDLLRLGQEEEGWKLADEAYAADPYDVTIYNLVNLRDELEKFTTLEAEGLQIRMSAHEADVYGVCVVELLTEAKETLTAKYKQELPETILVEIFPRPADFEVRTFGMPGVVGYLGVCFGNVITANSPASQSANPVNLEAVLWHEFAHVVTLNKTNNRMPRWLSEGISVYEERQRDPSWGERMSLPYREMILSGELSPIGEMSEMFLSPKSPMHVQFAYFQSSLIVEHLIENYGFDALLSVLDDLGVGMHINEALERHTAPLKQLDEEFSHEVIELAKTYGGHVDWTDADITLPESDEELKAKAIKWSLENRDNYRGLKLWSQALMDRSDWETAEKLLEQAVELFPSETSAESAHLMLAHVYRQQKELEKEKQALLGFIEIDDDVPAPFQRLIELATKQEDWNAVTEYARKLRAIKPLIPEPHAAIATAAEQLGDHRQAISALNALLELGPIDRAGLYYRKAVLLKETEELKLAKRHTLQSLEEAPRYRDALKLLVELNAREGNEVEPAVME